MGAATKLAFLHIYAAPLCYRGGVTEDSCQLFASKEITVTSAIVLDTRKKTFSFTPLSSLSQ